MKKFILIFVCFFVIGFLGSEIPAKGQTLSNEDISSRLEDLSSLIQMQQQEIERLKQELRQQKQSIQQAEEAQSEEVKKAVTAEVKQQGKQWKDSIPDWIKSTKVSGDLRLRYEGIYNRDQQQTDGSTKDLPNRDRYRIRARLYFDGKISDEISTHFMICTNQDSNQEASTTNQSFGNDFNDKGIYLHQAYATYKPQWLEGLELTAGKFKNTFLHTDIMWDPDVNPEGIYERYQYQGWDTFKPFVHLGQMVVNEENLQSDGAALYINQGGFDWQIGPVKWTLAGSYYNWTNLENTEYLHLADYKGGGGNTFTNKTGTLQYLYSYNLLEAITHVRFKVGSVPVKLIFDYIENSDNDVPSGQDTAYFAGFKLGKEKIKGDWSLFYKYARIEKDSVIGSMNDQDFYGANRKGHKVMFRYMLLDRLRFGTAFFYTDPVTAWDPTSPNWSNERSRGHEDRLQTEFVFKF